MSEDVKSIAAKLRDYWSDQRARMSSWGFKPLPMMDRRIQQATTLIEQQAARIAELESEITRARSLSDTEIELLRRAEAAEAEVKRLRVVLSSIIGCFDAAYAEGLQEQLSCEENTTLGSLHDLVVRRLLFAQTYAEAALTSQESRHD